VTTEQETGVLPALRALLKVEEWNGGEWELDSADLTELYATEYGEISAIRDVFVCAGSAEAWEDVCRLLASHGVVSYSKSESLTDSDTVLAQVDIDKLKYVIREQENEELPTKEARVNRVCKDCDLKRKVRDETWSCSLLPGLVTIPASCVFSVEHDPLEKSETDPLPQWWELTEKEKDCFRSATRKSMRIGSLLSEWSSHALSGKVDQLAVSSYSAARKFFAESDAVYSQSNKCVKWAKNRRMGVVTHVDGSVSLGTLSEAGYFDISMEFTEASEPEGKFEASFDRSGALVLAPVEKKEEDDG